jgi:hypothetical protein
MLNLANNPLTSESGLAAANPLRQNLNNVALRSRSGVRIQCSDLSAPAARFLNQGVGSSDVQRSLLVATRTQDLGGRERSTRIIPRVAAAANQIFPEDAFSKSQNGATGKSQNGAASKSQNGAATSKGSKVEVNAKGKWRKQSDSYLSDDDEPLPLPLTWPGSTPDAREKIDGMLQCDPEEQVSQ